MALLRRGRRTRPRTTRIPRGLRQADAVLRAIVESPRQIVIFALDLNYRYLAFNANHAQTMQRIWGVEIRVGANMLDLIGRDDDRAKAKLNFDRALAGESFTLIEEYGDTRIERRFYEDIYSPVRDHADRTIGVAVYLTDITEHLRAQQELARYQHHLEELVEQRTRELETAHASLLHAQKLESLGVLAGGIAHDFNNLLAIILGHAELGLGQLRDGSHGWERLGMIREATLEARMLTKQLLSYSGKGKLVVAPLDLNRVVHAVTQLSRATINKDIRIDFALEPGPIAVRGDATQLRQVILNLVTNAAEAIGTNTGQIHVRTGILDATAEMLQNACFVSELAGSQCAYLEVEDTGSGIDDSTRSRLFDPFYTTKVAGRGLGLAAVLGIIRSHQGTILLTTSPGRGSCFRILLPAVDAAEISEEPSPSSRIRTVFGGGCALVVDDEAAVRTATRSTLETMGYAVLEADGGRSACLLYERHRERIDVVLLDLAMPDMNGEQTLRQLRRLGCAAPAILVTAYAEDEFRSRFAADDLAAFIAKPFTREELAEALDAAAGLCSPQATDTADAPSDSRR